ncbi:class I SAM-dependent methyltransferase [Candidatus Micrarchaeota archaeon]|nr:class I SAM-dependent methyltransferase [Candidatus Micrarchaeota archaeon]
MSYNSNAEWNREYDQRQQMAFPSEYLVRIFKGTYPHLDLDKISYKSKKLCDVGCGDGRNLVLFNQLGFELYGTELTHEIVTKSTANLNSKGIAADVRVGKNDHLPFDDAFFDYAISWNVCYYMGNSFEFEKHVRELQRVLKKGGYLILSIPKKTSFIYSDSEDIKSGYKLIKNDFFKVRNGEILKIFEDEKDIEKAFSPYFGDFVFGSIHDNCFGLNYHWHLVVCKKR